MVERTDSESLAASLVLMRDAVPHVRFLVGDGCTLGRSSECEVQLLDPQLSRCHARIVRVGDAHLLEDLGSRNGTRLNGQRVEGRLRLRPGDAIALGETVLLFDPPLELLHGRGEGPPVCLVEDDPGTIDRVELAPGMAMTLDVRALADVHAITCELLSQLDLDRLLPALLDRLLAQFGADRGVVLLCDGPGGQVRPAVVRSDRGALAVSRGLVARVLADRAPLLVRNALEDVAFEGARSVVAYGMRSVIAVPLLDGDEVLGIVELDHRSAEAFDDRSLAQLALLAPVAARAVQNARQVNRERRQHAALAAAGGGPGVLVGASPALSRILEAARRAGRTDARVLITGESGTGKELVARQIHAAGARAERPWVALNCGAVPETLLESELFGHEKGAFTGAVRQHRGCFEQADGGTLFLDEIGEIGPTAQVRLLRVLQEGSFHRIGSERPLSVDVRVIAATNRPLERLVEEGRFRQDLYYRLNVVRLELPPLRERPGDVSLLLDHFLARHAAVLGRRAPTIDPAARSLLERHRWPGNVRELANVVERLLVLAEGPVIRASDLPPEIGPTAVAAAGDARALTLPEVLAETERELIVRALRETRGKKAAACRLLGISRPTLDKKIRDYGLEVA